MWKLFKRRSYSALPGRNESPQLPGNTNLTEKTALLGAKRAYTFPLTQTSSASQAVSASCCATFGYAYAQGSGQAIKNSEVKQACNKQKEEQAAVSDASLNQAYVMGARR